MQEGLVQPVKIKIQSFADGTGGVSVPSVSIISSGQVIQLHTLTQNHPHPVVNSRSVKTQYEPTVLLTLKTYSDINIIVYLPKRYTDVIDYTHIDHNNLGRSNYTLIYIRKSG